MKKSLLSAFFATFLLVTTGCATEHDPEAKFTNWRESFDSFECSADITMHSGDEVSDFNLTANYSQDECSVIINSPETIKGVSASRVGDETSLQYDDLILSLGDVSGVSPMSSMAILGDAIKNGFVNMCYEEQGGESNMLALQLDIGDNITVYLWLNSDDLVPQYADIKVEDEVIIKMDNFNWKTT